MSAALDVEALQLFHAGTSQRAEWDDFTARQKDHWRAVAVKAREIHTPVRAGIAAIVLEHWPKEYNDPRYPTSVHCAAVGCVWLGRFPGDIAEHIADLVVAAHKGEAK